MFARGLKNLLLLPCGLRVALASMPYNHSPDLCERAYNNITHLGAYDSPFLRDSSTEYSLSGNQYYNSTLQLAAGVRLLSAQVQWNQNALHVCHTSCELSDAGVSRDWLREVHEWLLINPNEVATVLLVNGAGASAAELAAEYEAAGDLAGIVYKPSSTNSWIKASASISSSSSPSANALSIGLRQDWPTLQSLINNGTRLISFVASVEDNSDATYLMGEFTYIFENNYNVTTPSVFSCEANRPSSLNGKTHLALSEGLMPLMNHFLYELEPFDIELPNETYISTTNSETGGEGNLGSAADTCIRTYGKAPNSVLVDFFNVGPAIDTVDRLNGVTDAVGRINLSTAALNGRSKSAGVALVAFSHAAMLCSAFLAFAIVIA